MQLSLSDLYSDLDRGDGICRYFDLDTKLCSIYEQRPAKCNIDQMYHLFFESKMSKEQFYELNYLACVELKRRLEL